MITPQVGITMHRFLMKDGTWLGVGTRAEEICSVSSFFSHPRSDCSICIFFLVRSVLFSQTLTFVAKHCPTNFRLKLCPKYTIILFCLNYIPFFPVICINSMCNIIWANTIVVDRLTLHRFPNFYL